MAQMWLSKKHKEVLGGDPGILEVRHLPKLSCTPHGNRDAEEGTHKNLTLMRTLLPCLTTSTTGTFVAPEGKEKTTQEKHLFATPPVSPQAGNSSHPSPPTPSPWVSNNGVKLTAFTDQQQHRASHIA